MATLKSDKMIQIISWPFRKLGLLIEWFELTVLSLGVFVLAIILITNVIFRTFFVSIYFTEEISEFLMLMITFTGLSYAVRKARHIRMGAIFDMLPPKLQKGMVFFIQGICMTVMFLMAYYAYDYVNWIMTMERATPALRLPYWTFYVIVPVGFFSAGIQYIRAIIKNITSQQVWLSPEQKSEYEDEIVY